MQEKPKVAFICVHNSCRSQIAEALGKYLAGEVFESYSAGTEIAPEINREAVRLMKRLYGIDMEQTQCSKRLDDLPPVDIVVTMGCNVACPHLPCRHREDWGGGGPHREGRDGISGSDPADSGKGGGSQKPIAAESLTLAYSREEICRIAAGKNGFADRRQPRCNCVPAGHLGTAHLMELSRKTMTTIRLNRSFSIGLDFPAIVLPITNVLAPVSGVLVHNTGSVLVILNSTLLLRWKNTKLS